MKHTGLVREEGTKPPGGADRAADGARTRTPALAGGIMFSYDCEGDAPPGVSRKKHNHLFYTSCKDGILKTAPLLLLRGERANEKTFQCLFYPMNLRVSFPRHCGPDV